MSQVYQSVATEENVKGSDSFYMMNNSDTNQGTLAYPRTMSRSLLNTNQSQSGYARHRHHSKESVGKNSVVYSPAA